MNMKIRNLLVGLILATGIGGAQADGIQQGPGCYYGGNCFAGNGSAAAPSYSFSSQTGTGLHYLTSNWIIGSSGGTDSIGINSATTVGLQVLTTLPIGWGSLSGVSDTGLSRISAGVVGIGTGAAGSTAGVLYANAARYTGTPTFTGLTGLELSSDGTTTSIIRSYDRTNTVYKALNVDALSQTFFTQGSTLLTLSGSTAAVTGTITASAIASSGAAQSGYLCYNTTGGVITYDGGATCLVSREEYKDNLGPINNGLDIVLALEPFWGKYKDGTPMGDHHVQPFLGARHTAAVDGRLASYDAAGEPLGVRYDTSVAVLVSAIQKQQEMIEVLKKELDEVKNMQYTLTHPKPDSIYTSLISN